VVVLKEERAVLADTLGLIWVRHGNAIGGGVKGVLGLSVPVIEVVAVDIARTAAIGAVVGGINC
jgi:hypothetical protein